LCSNQSISTEEQGPNNDKKKLGFSAMFHQALTLFFRPKKFPNTSLHHNQKPHQDHKIKKSSSQKKGRTRNPNPKKIPSSATWIIPSMTFRSEIDHE
jgi:hypothetical protein